MQKDNLSILLHYICMYPDKKDQIIVELQYLVLNNIPSFYSWFSVSVQ